MNFNEESLNKILKNEDINTITLDVFDTILLRKIHPEGLQFLLVGKNFSSIIKSNMGISINEYEIYSYREYSRRQIISGKKQKVEKTEFIDETIYDVDTNLEEWFNSLIDIIATKHQVKINDEVRNKVVKEMIDCEIKTEIDEVIPNKKVIKIIKAIKNKFPMVKIYFLSDMYLTREQIFRILESHNCSNLFDGGVSSTDIQKSKTSGKIFSAIHNSDILSSSFNIFKNVHIGDNKHSDVEMPRRNGSYTLHYKTSIIRKLAHITGKIKLNRIKKTKIRQQRKKLHQKTLNKKDPKDIWGNVSLLFTQPLFAFLLHVGTIANIIGDKKKFMFVSSEGKTFYECGKKYLKYYFEDKDNMLIADKLNRVSIIKAFIYKLSLSDSIENSELIIKMINYGEVNHSRIEIYNFYFTKEYPVSEMILNQIDNRQFINMFFRDYKNADKKYTKHLEDCYNYVINFLPDDKETIVCVDIGWEGTVQKIFSQFIKLHGKNNKVEGLYMGYRKINRFPISLLNIPANGLLMEDLERKDGVLFNPVMWEYVYTNKPQFVEDHVILEKMRAGNDNEWNFFTETETEPIEYFKNITKKIIIGFLARPTREEIMAVGNIKFDKGFVNRETFRIMDFNQSRLHIYKDFLLHPKSEMRKIIGSNIWKMGYIRWYRLYGFKTMLKLAGLIKHKKYI